MIRSVFLAVAAGTAALAADVTLDEDRWPDVTPEWGPCRAPRPFGHTWRETAYTSTAARVAVCLKAQVAPSRAKAGEPVRLTFEFDGAPPPLPFSARLLFKSKDGVNWCERLALGEEQVRRTGRDRWQLSFSLALPLYCNTEDFRLELVTDAFRAPGGEKGARYETSLHLDRLPAVPGFERPVTAEVRQVAGSPRFFVNGKPFFAEWGGVQWQRRPDVSARHSDMPLSVVTIHSADCRFWKSCDRFELAELDFLAESYRRENPDAWFIWNVTVMLPPDWQDRHLDEMCRDEQGRINEDTAEGELNHSFSSERALADLEAAFVKVLEYLERAPYANRIIGYSINSGHTTEWLNWDPSHGETVLDFSRPARNGFAAFAAQRYPALADRAVPTFAERRVLDGGRLLWDQRRHLKAIAYHDYCSNLTADALIRMCRRAREIVGAHKLIGSYYGYTMTLNASGHAQMRSHYALKKVLDAGVLDFAMSPQGYGFASRLLGQTCCDMKPFKSFANHGIVPVIEDDTRTHNGQRLPVGIHQTLTEAQSIAILARNMSIALCRNEPNYHYQLTLGTECDFPAWMPYAAALRKTGEHCVGKSVRRNAEIAVVVSEETIKAMPMLFEKPVSSGEVHQVYDEKGRVRTVPITGVPLTRDIFSLAYTRYARIGAPVDYLLAEDLKDNLGGYKLYLFVNCYKADAGLRAAAAELRRRNGVLVWQYAPGYLSEEGNAVEKMKELTGITFSEIAEPIRSAVTMVADGRIMGTPAAVFAPHFAPVVADEILGRYDGGQTGVAAVRTGAATSVFVGTERLDLPFLRSLAKRAGVHVYSETGDPVEANEHLFTLHARFAGRKTVRLPYKTTVLDVFGRRIVARDADAFTFEAPLHTSWLFYFGDDADDLLVREVAAP